MYPQGPLYQSYNPYRSNVQQPVVYVQEPVYYPSGYQMQASQPYGYQYPPVQQPTPIYEPHVEEYQDNNSENGNGQAAGLINYGVGYLKLLHQQYLYASSMVQPFVYLSIVFLLVAAVLAALIYPSVKGDTFLQTPTAVLVFQRFQAQYASRTITAIQQNVQCPTGWSPLELGHFNGVSNGCICPNLQTSIQSCPAGCNSFNSTSSVPLNKFQALSVCVIYGQERPLNHIELRTGRMLAKHQDDQAQTITIGDKQYVLSNQGTDAPFYQFTVAPNVPCLNDQQFPQTRNGLSYPFYRIPYQGCDSFGSMTDETYLLGSTTQRDLFTSNNLINLTGLPLFTKYVNLDDPQSLYIERQIKLADGVSCEKLKHIDVGSIVTHCNSIKVITQVMCLLTFLSGAAGLVAFIWNLIESKSRQLNLQFQKKYLDDTLRKTIVILGLLVSTFVLLLTAFYYSQEIGYGSLQDSRKTLSDSEKKNCFTNVGMKQAQKQLLTLSGTCVSNFSHDLNILTLVVIVYLVLMGIIGYQTYRTNTRGHNKKQN